MKKSDYWNCYQSTGFISCLRAIETLTKSIQQIINYYSISDFLLAHSDSAKEYLYYSNLLDFFVLGSFAVLLSFGSKIVTRKICNKSDYSDNAQLFTDNKTFIEIAIVIIGGLLLVIQFQTFYFGYIHTLIMFRQTDCMINYKFFCDISIYKNSYWSTVVIL